MKKIISVFLLVVLLTTTVLATTTQQKLNNTNSQIKDQKNELNSIKSQQKTTLNQINSLDTSINSATNQIESIEEEIERLEDGIVVAQENIKYMQEKYDEKLELRKDRVVAYYKRGSTSLEGITKNIEDPTDKLYLERAIAKIAEYDKELLDEIKVEQTALDAEKQTLESDIVRCAELKDDLEVKIAELTETKEVRTQYLAVLNADAKALEQSIDALTKEADALEKELAKTTSTGKYTGGKMTWPLPGHYIITSKFGNRLHPILKVYKLHTGVDIAGSGCNGSPVVAAAAGTVIKATYSTAYGNYIIIDHGGGITTLYAHSSKLLVKAGDKVERGQEIMKVGTTGYSTGPHLHFEVRENGKYVNPLDGYISAK